ncbi:unnamed protein product [Mytilus coruscus]|uniref:Uncharacterized protein n=1 Tax=Mytilus coruscus TaxID=42192 RepID=A0A6J8CEQ9_MYTCO|nr:unnamed protein product [Mytilus coruscus]
MADRRAPRFRQRTNQWDSADPVNWTADKLKDELEKINIFVLVSLGKNMLKKIYLDNIARRNVAPADQQMTGNSSQTSASSDNAPNITSSDASAILNADRIASSNQVQRDLTPGSGSNSARSSAVTEPRMNFAGNQPPLMLTTLAQYTQPRRRNDPGPSTSSGAESSQTFPLNGGYRFPISEFGVPSICILHVDIVSDVIKKRIWEGKDVNLAALLISKHEADKNIVQEQGSITVNLSNHEDTRLLKSLTISEFITAFGKYKRVMCSKKIYGAKFYDYHCQFSARAAAALRDCNIKVDWSIKDTTMLSIVAGNAKVNSCSNCSSTMHLSSFCPQLGTNKVANTANSSKGSNFGVKDVDRYGRKRYNPAYFDIIISKERLAALPNDGELSDILTVEYQANTVHISDNSPAPDQSDPGEIEGYTHSSVILPDPYIDSRKKVEDIVSDVVGQAHGDFTINKKRTNDYFHDVMSPAFGITTYWYRQEFAKSLRLEMVKDHPMLVQHFRFNSQGWRANGDISLIVSKSDADNPSVDDNLCTEKYVCGYACKVPVLTGCNIQASWPLDENYCRTMLLLHTPNWRQLLDVKNDNLSWVHQMESFLQTDVCPNFVKADIEKVENTSVMIIRKMIFLLVLNNSYTNKSDQFETLRMVVSGTAGSGCLVKAIRNIFSSNKSVQVLCPTGNSANIISGVTLSLHSFLKIPTHKKGQEMKPLEGILGENLQSNCDGVKVLLVDERSLIGATTLCWMEFMCRYGMQNGENFEKSWGDYL